MLQAADSDIRILLVDDNPGDIRLAEEAFREAGYEHPLFTAKDGFEALSFLRRDQGYETAPRPDIILLDLNLPRKSGLEILQEIKEDQDLRIIPVVMLTTSSYEGDVREAYRLNASSYMLKPSDFDTYVQNLETLLLFWRDVAKLCPN